MRRIVMLLASMGVAVPAVADASHQVTRLQPLALHDGVNQVRSFLPDGADALVVQAWRANGNAHGHHDWLVLGPAAGGHGADVVTLADPRTGMLRDTISDAPFDGERVLGTVRFARGLVDGRPASLLLEVLLDEAPNGVLADHATATLRIYRLDATDGGAGDSPFEFRLVSSDRSPKSYCNADLALSQMLDLPLSPNYAGPKPADGCFKD